MNKNIVRAGSLLFSITSVFAASAYADKAPTAVGSAFQINAGSIASHSTTPATAVAKDGSFVVAWAAQEGSDTAPNIYARRFAANGSPLTQDIRVNAVPLPTSALVIPGIVTDANGDFAITWMTDFLTSAPQLGAIKIRLFHADGSPVGAEFCVDSACSSTALGSSIAMDDAGDFAVVRELYTSVAGTKGKPDEITTTIDATRFTASGTRKDQSPIVVASVTAPDNTPLGPADVRNGTAAMDPATGELAVSWLSESGLVIGQLEFINSSTLVRRFGADGKPVGVQRNFESCNELYSIGGIGLSSFTGCLAGVIQPGGPLRYTSQGLTEAWVELFGFPTNTGETEYTSFHQKSFWLGIGFDHLVAPAAGFVTAAAGVAEVLDADGTLVLSYTDSTTHRITSQAFNSAGASLDQPFQVGPALSNPSFDFSINHGSLLYAWSAGAAPNVNVYGQLYKTQ